MVDIMGDLFSEEEIEAGIEYESRKSEELFHYTNMYFSQYEKYQLTNGNKKLVKESISFCLDDLNTRLIDYIMRSSVEDIYIIQSECRNKKIVLMTIPTLKIGFDLVNRKKEQFFECKPEYNESADIYDAIMDKLVTSFDCHGSGMWNFYAIDDVIKMEDDNYFISLDVIKKIGKLNLDKGEDFPQKKNDQIASSPIATFLLNSMFKGESNWACGRIAQIAG